MALCAGGISKCCSGPGRNRGGGSLGSENEAGLGNLPPPTTLRRRSNVSAFRSVRIISSAHSRAVSRLLVSVLSGVALGNEGRDGGGGVRNSEEGIRSMVVRQQACLL